METIRLSRRLRQKNLEAFRFRRGWFGPTIAYVILVDYRRPSTLDDFPFLKDVEEEREFSRDNFILVIVIHGDPIEQDEREEVINIASGLLENKESCHWTASFDPIAPEEIAAMDESQQATLACFERILKVHDFSAELTTVPASRFNYLSQD